MQTHPDVLLTCQNDVMQAVNEGACICVVLWDGQFVPDTWLLQGQTQTRKSPLQIHAQGQLVLEKMPHNHLGHNRYKAGQTKKLMTDIFKI